MLVREKKVDFWKDNTWILYCWEFFISVGDDSVYLHLKTNDYCSDPETTTKLISLNDEYVAWLFEHRNITECLFESDDWFISDKHSDGATKYRKELLQHMDEMLTEAGYKEDSFGNPVIEDDELPF